MKNKIDQFLHIRIRTILVNFLWFNRFNIKSQIDPINKNLLQLPEDSINCNRKTGIKDRTKYRILYH